MHSRELGHGLTPWFQARKGRHTIFDSQLPKGRNIAPGQRFVSARWAFIAPVPSIPGPTAPGKGCIAVPRLTMQTVARSASKGGVQITVAVSAIRSHSARRAPVATHHSEHLQNRKSHAVALVFSHYPTSLRRRPLSPKRCRDRRSGPNENHSRNTFRRRADDSPPGALTPAPAHRGGEGAKYRRTRSPDYRLHIHRASSGSKGSLTKDSSASARSMTRSRPTRRRFSARYRHTSLLHRRDRGLVDEPRRLSAPFEAEGRRIAASHTAPHGIHTFARGPGVPRSPGSRQGSPGAGPPASPAMTSLAACP